MAFRKVERSYDSTPNGWRLATYEEAKNGLETIKKKNLLKRWDRVRLLDGWITGPGYNFEMGDDFKGCLGYMLLIQTEASGGAYAGVYLSDRGKEVALLLCVDDWNYEVVYWLLNTWSNSQTMKVWEVRVGNIPLSDMKKFEEMNKMMGHVARRLGEEGGKAFEKSRKTKYTGTDSVKEVLSGIIKIVTTEEDIVQFIGELKKFPWYKFGEDCLPDSVKTGDSAEPFWSFVCDSFVGYHVKICACTSLVNIRKMKTEGTGQNKWIIATSILFHLSHFLTDIIHEPMAHNCKDYCANKILHNAEKKAAGNQREFIKVLKKNAMWRCYDDTHSYGVLNKLLVVVAKPKYNDIEEGEKLDAIDMLLQCGAQPGIGHAIGKYKNKTVLHSIAKFRDEDVGTEVAQALLNRCDEQCSYEFINTEDERGKTALHSASEKGNARICRLLLDCGALVTAHDKKGMTALHYAFQRGIDKVIDMETEVAKALLSRCDEGSICDFVNAEDERGRTALHSASEKGNARICRLLVDRGAVVTGQDKKGMTALHYAFEGTKKVIDAETQIAEALLSRVDVQSMSKYINAADNRGRTALHGASKNGNASICKLLVDRGALVTVQDKYGMTALHHASEGKINKVKGAGIEIAQALLSKCDERRIYEFINAADKRGRTALHGASEKGDTRICELLVGRGALATAQDERGRTALHCASEKGNTDICKLLVDGGASVNAQDKKGRTALHCAFERGTNKVADMEIEIAKALLSRCDEQSINEFVNAADERGMTALHLASEKGNTDICELLVDHGASVTAQDIKGMTALHYALQGGIAEDIDVGTEVTKALLSRCDDHSKYGFINTIDERGRTALHCASEKGNTDICKLLVDCGASVNAQDKEGMTALHYAFEGRINKVINVGIEIAQALLNSCDVQSINTADKTGRTALHIASQKGNADICKKLIDRGASVTAKANNGKTTLHCAFEGGIGKDIDAMAEIIEALLCKCNAESKYEFVNAADEKGRTALHSASEKGNAYICKKLIDHVALVTAQNKEGMTALHYAFEGGIGKDIDAMAEIALALLCNCDEQSKYEFVNASDKRGRTALHIASGKGDARVCRLLLDHGASVTAQNKRGMTALHYAIDGGIDEVVDELVKNLHVTESLDLKDNRECTPLDIALTKVDNKSAVKLLLQSKDPKAYLGRALANMNYETKAKLVLKSKEPEAYLDIALPLMDHESTAKLLSKFKNPEAYFNKVDQQQLLRYSLVLGFEDIVDKLSRRKIRLPAGDCDENEKTTLHLAAMCDNRDIAYQIFTKKIAGEISANVNNMVAKCDKEGRTVLHEAALNGHISICGFLLNVNSELIYFKDRERRNPLHYAVKGKYTGTALYKQLLTAYLKKDKPNDDLMDRSGLTPLHVAASEGKVQVVKELLSWEKIKTKYLSRGDILAQTALHKAVKRGHIDTVEILLEHGAHPLRERDRDGRTALHYVVKAETQHKKELALRLLGACKSDEEKSLLLWASAAGLGTADQGVDLGNPKDEVHKFLADERKMLKKGNLLKIAVSLENIEMTKELISRGYQIGDICYPRLPESNKENVNETVNRVVRETKIIKEQGNDKPTISDSLGRLNYAQGLAALFLNPYIKPPITVGITGSWGTGKSSLMLQAERILLTTAAQMALLPSSRLSSSALELPDITPCELSEEGKMKCEHIYRQIKRGEGVNRNIFVILWDYIKSKVKQTSIKDVEEELEIFLNQYDLKYIKVFKALAAMDSSDMSQPKADRSGEENVQAVLTVQYNAWRYRNDTEALAGIAVEITKELEGIMTQAQWLNTCWRNTWNKEKYTLWIEIFFPSILTLVLVSLFTWITWVIFDNEKLKEWEKAKYAWPPAALIIIVWTLTRSIMGILKPVSTQLLQHISFPDHSNQLGYQERVISDISFLKDEVGKKAYWVFIVFAWIFTTFRALWGVITKSSITSLLFHNRSHEKAIEAPKVTPASGNNLRIIVFVDDLDRCQESVILQVLSAVNLVLAVCEISVVIGMDRRLIERAIIKKYKDVNANKSRKANQELADMYLQKIIQLPLDLPDPGDQETKMFLRQLGVLENEERAYTKEDGTSSNGGGEGEAVQQNTTEQVTLNMETSLELADMRLEVIGKETPSSSILVREMLFVRYYSKGEEEAFLYFQGLATDCRRHPREWKRLLNYHRLVWYIFYVSKEASNLVGWQVQLVTWIFICWEWQEYMNLVIKKWKEISDLKMNAPSLLMIVKYLIEKRERENMKATSCEEDISKSTDDFQTSESASSGRLANALDKSLVELKKEMKQLKELVISHELKFKEHVSDELKKIKEQIVSKESGKSGESWETEKENWERMKSALEKYDVSMDGIQAFQRFRFYCIAGYLPPLGKGI